MNALLKLPFRYLSVSLFIFISSTLFGQEGLNIQLVPKFYSGGYNISCHGLNDGAISSQISGGTQPYSFSWSNGENGGKIEHLIAGTYSLTVSDASTPVKTSTQSITIYEPAVLKATENASTYGTFEVSTPTATDGSIDIQVNGGAGAFSIVWSNGSTQTKLSNLSVGNYTYTLTDESGCIKQGSVQLTAPPTFSANVTILNHIECGDDFPASAYVSISGGVPPYLVKWGTGSAGDTAHYLNPGIQEVYIQDAIGGVIHPSFEIVKYEKPKFNLQSSSYANGFEVSCYNCYNGQIEVVTSNQENGPYTYVWNTGATSSLISGLGAGNFSVTVSDARNCAVTAEVTLNAPERDDWTMGGNANTNPETQFIGTSDETDVVFKTNLQEAMRLAASGNMGIGISNPNYKLDVNGSVRLNQQVVLSNLPDLPNLTEEQENTFKYLVMGDDGSLYKITGLPQTLLPEPRPCKTTTTGDYLTSWISVPGAPSILYAGIETCIPYVGIGTDAPLANLHVNGESRTEYKTSAAQAVFGNFTSYTEGNSKVSIPAFNMSVGSSALTIDHQTNLNYLSSFVNRVNNDKTKAIVVNQSTIEQETFIVYGDGTTVIGYDSSNPITPDNETQLAVNGLVTSRGVLVTQGLIPDYVFDPNRKLMTLSEIQRFITINKHLPGVTSADDVLNNKGIWNIGDFQLQTLEKVEELYLHLIELNERLTKLEKENAELRKSH